MKPSRGATWRARCLTAVSAAVLMTGGCGGSSGSSDLPDPDADYVTITVWGRLGLGSPTTTKSGLHVIRHDEDGTISDDQVTDDDGRVFLRDFEDGDVVSVIDPEPYLYVYTIVGIHPGEELRVSTASLPFQDKGPAYLQVPELPSEGVVQAVGPCRMSSDEDRTVWVAELDETCAPGASFVAVFQAKLTSGDLLYSTTEVTIGDGSDYDNPVALNPWLPADHEMQISVAGLPVTTPATGLVSTNSFGDFIPSLSMGPQAGPDFDFPAIDPELVPTGITFETKDFSVWAWVDPSQSSVQLDVGELLADPGSFAYCVGPNATPCVSWEAVADMRDVRTTYTEWLTASGSNPLYWIVFGPSSVSGSVAFPDLPESLADYRADRPTGQGMVDYTRVEDWSQIDGYDDCRTKRGIGFSEPLVMDPGDYYVQVDSP